MPNLSRVMLICESSSKCVDSQNIIPCSQFYQSCQHIGAKISTWLRKCKVHFVNIKKLFANLHVIANSQFGGRMTTLTYSVSQFK